MPISVEGRFPYKVAVVHEGEAYKSKQGFLLPASCLGAVT